VGPVERLSLGPIGRASLAARCLLLAAVYAALGALGLAVVHLHGAATSLWAPSGLALAALVLLGPRVWPGIALGNLVLNIGHGMDPALAALLAAGSTGEALGGWWLLRRAGFRPELARVRDVPALLVGAGVMATLISAVIGPSVIAARDGLALDEALRTAWVWWCGDMGGVLVVAPLLLAVATRRARQPVRVHPLEAFALAALLTLGLAAFAGSSAHPYLLVPPLVWAALRFGVVGAGPRRLRA
jgi:integral membrane sensor domain MASE1